MSVRIFLGLPEEGVTRLLFAGAFVPVSVVVGFAGAFGPDAVFFVSGALAATGAFALATTGGSGGCAFGPFPELGIYYCILRKKLRRGHGTRAHIGDGGGDLGDRRRSKLGALGVDELSRPLFHGNQITVIQY